MLTAKRTMMTPFIGIILQHGIHLSLPKVFPAPSPAQGATSLPIHRINNNFMYNNRRGHQDILSEQRTTYEHLSGNIAFPRAGCGITEAIPYCMRGHAGSVHHPNPAGNHPDGIHNEDYAPDHP